MRYTVPEALAAFHARYAGASDRVFSRGQDDAGRSSYARLAETVPPEAEVVFDLACGDGAMLQRLQRPGRRQVGLDRSPEELAAARARLGPEATLVLGMAQELPFEDGSFDAATCHMAFMFFEEPSVVVGELRRVLKPQASFAAVLGRPSPRDPFASDFMNALREAEALDEQRVAWTMAAGSEPALLKLFEGWSPRYEPFDLTIPIPVAEAWSFLRLCYYDAGLLGESSSRWLEARTNALLDAHGIHETLRWRVGMALLRATRPA